MTQSIPEQFIGPQRREDRMKELLLDIRGDDEDSLPVLGEYMELYNQACRALDDRPDANGAHYALLTEVDTSESEFDWIVAKHDYLVQLAQPAMRKVELRPL